MCDDRQPLYRDGRFEPIAGYTDAVFLTDAGGPVSKYTDEGASAFFGITGIRPFFMGPHSFFAIWAHAAMGAGYGAAPSGMPIGALAAGGNQVYAAPTPLNLGAYGLVQARFTLEQVALAGPVLDDIDLGITFGSISDYSVPQIPGRYNAVDQFPTPADSIAGPASGANKALPAAFAAVDPVSEANLTELFWFENNPPSFTLFNNGIASTAGMIGLRLKGFRYFLKPLRVDDTWAPKFIAGAYRLAPPTRVVVAPTVPITGTTNY